MHKTYTAREFLRLIQGYQYATLTVFVSKKSYIYMSVETRDTAIEMVGDNAHLFLNAENPFERNFIIVGNEYKCTVLSVDKKLKMAFQTEGMELPIEIVCF